MSKIIFINSKKIIKYIAIFIISPFLYSTLGVCFINIFNRRRAKL